MQAALNLLMLPWCHCWVQCIVTSSNKVVLIVLHLAMQAALNLLMSALVSLLGQVYCDI